jgi:hypothetical protein
MKQSIFKIFEVVRRTPGFTPKTPITAWPISLPEYLVNHESQDMLKCYDSINEWGRMTKWWLVLYESCGWMGQDIVEPSLRKIHANSGGAESQQQLQHLFKIDTDDGGSARLGKMVRNHDHDHGRGIFQRVCQRCHSWCDGHKSVRERIRRVVKKCEAYWVWLLETPCVAGAVRFGYARIEFNLQGVHLVMVGWVSGGSSSDSRVGISRCGNSGRGQIMKFEPL